MFKFFKMVWQVTAATLCLFACTTMVLVLLIVPMAVIGSGDRCGVVAGTEISVAGYGDRPAYLQTSVDPTAPLVVMLHGKNGCVGAMQRQSHLGDHHDVSVLWLSGHNTPSGRQWDAWNGRVGSSTRSYLRAVVAATGLRPRSTVVAGISMGAFTAMWLGCNMPDLFDGAFVVAGVTNTRCPHAGTSLMMVVGARDSSIGGGSAADRGLSMWASRVVSCGAIVKSTVPNRVLLTLSGCPARVIVKAAVLSGVGHEWPEYFWFDTDAELIRFAFQIAPIPVLYPVRFV